MQRRREFLQAHREFFAPSRKFFASGREFNPRSAARRESGVEDGPPTGIPFESGLWNFKAEAAVAGCLGQPNVECHDAMAAFCAESKLERIGRISLRSRSHPRDSAAPPRVAASVRYRFWSMGVTAAPWA